MPAIHNAVLIGAPIEKVYNAITTQEDLSAWWTPNVKANAKANSLAHFPFKDGYFKEMKITDLEPFKLVKWSCVKGKEQWIGTTISFELIHGIKENLLGQYPEMSGQIEQLNSGRGTLLIFNHSNWKEYTLMFAECTYTWGQFLKSLKLYCETGKGKPFPQQHH